MFDMHLHIYVCIKYLAIFYASHIKDVLSLTKINDLQVHECLVYRNAIWPTLNPNVNIPPTGCARVTQYTSK